MARHKRGITTKGIVIIATILLVANTTLAILLSLQSERAIIEQINARMLDVACSAAELLDGDSLATLTAEDEQSQTYQQAMSTLRAFQDNVELSYIYCVRPRDDGSFEFTVDPTVDEPADFGETVQRTEALESAAAGVSAVDPVPYEDRWGRFYSAYAPVRDSSGKVVAIVGVDFAASWYEDHETYIRRLVIVNCVASLVLALLAVFGASKLASSQKRHIKSLQRAMLYDPLTGLPRMGHFFELAKDAHKKTVGSGEEPAILYVDLIGMRFFNQRQGFAAGDKLLCAFANLLTRHFGTDRCGRFGQDYFAVATNAEDLDNRLPALFAESAKINGGNNLPVRIGIYRESLGKVDISTACDRAKAANVANRGATTSVFAYFDETMLADIHRRHYVTSNIDRAIEEGWIQVYYQPIVRASNGRVCDEEALARWQDPEQGFLSPAEFVPALEDTKLVYKLDLNVLEQALAKMHRLKEEGLHIVPSSINLSRSDFEMCDMVEEVRKRVDAAGIPHDRINVELTETAIGQDFDFMKAQIDRFHELGFQVWMDDFGSEYSSLDYLQRLDFDLMKFDMRFMQQFDHSERSRIILTELTRMAVGLGIDTIAEGVETREQADFLREIGCNKLQGYLFTKPLSLDEVLWRYENGTAIGFENPAESDYFEALGHVSLYDLSSVARGDETLHDYFDTLPMTLVETTDATLKLIRHNTAYRAFMAKALGTTRIDVEVSYERASSLIGAGILRSIIACREEGDRAVIDGQTPSGTTVHGLVRCVAINPITHKRALVVAILSTVDKPREGVAR